MLPRFIGVGAWPTAYKPTSGMRPRDRAKRSRQEIAGARRLGNRSYRRAKMSPGDILRNSVKEKLARNEVVASMTVRLIGSVEIARIAHTAGFDTFYVDMQHSSLSLESCGQICVAALAVGIAPFVRVAANTPD